MFRDNSLIPSEAIRLAALGFLAEGPRGYGELAAQIRHFTGAITGPSLDLMGTSLELLRFEGLVAAGGESGGENARLEITPKGRAALLSLLLARLRTPLGDYNRLALLLKLRFLELLPVAEREAQVALIADSVEGELARLKDLRRTESRAPHLLAWLDQDIAALDARLAALRSAVPA
jgi:DNA-binding PadR family transcriptional regulator